MHTHTYGVSDYTVHYKTRLAWNGQNRNPSCDSTKSGTPPLDRESYHILI